MAMARQSIIKLSRRSSSSDHPPPPPPLTPLPLTPPTTTTTPHPAFPINPNCASDGNPGLAATAALALFISPEAHISAQFYTFNVESNALMIRCLVERRLAAAEIRGATPRAVLKSWRTVWKDRNEDKAWKRIQDKLSAHVDGGGNKFLC